MITGTDAYGAGLYISYSCHRVVCYGRSSLCPIKKNEGQKTYPLAFYRLTIHFPRSQFAYKMRCHSNIRVKMRLQMTLWSHAIKVISSNKQSWSGIPNVSLF